MNFADLRRRLRRYREENPHSHTAKFFFLDTFLGLLKVLLVCVGLFGGLSAGKAWMKPQDLVSRATVSATEEVVKQSPLPQSPVEPVTEIQTSSFISVSAAVLVDEKIEIVEQTKPSVIQFDDNWILNQSRSSFTVQLGNSLEKDKLVAFANELLIDEQAHIYMYKVSRIGNPIYGLGFGLFPDLKSAQAYIETLPESYRQFDPWIRPLGELQDQIVQAKERLAL